VTPPAADPHAALPELTPAELRRYGRHLVIPEVGEEGQRRLKAARVLLVGAGGLGSPLALYLAAAGVGRLGVVEFDRVDESNLQRQVLFGSEDVGRPKLAAASERLRAVNPHVEVVPYAERLGAGNALELVGGYDVVADGSDNFATRYLVNDACVRLGKPDVWGAVQRFEGQVSVFWAPRGPCYRCLFPEPPPAGVVPSCAEAGVLGVLPGIVGTLQASEVLKLLLGVGEPLLGRFLVFDALAVRFRELALRKAADCPSCGAGAARGPLVEYEELCGEAPARSGEGEAMGEALEELEIDVAELRRWQAAGRDLTVLDVREPRELAMGRIEGSLLIPLRELPRKIDELDADRPLVVYCHLGMRSLHAVQLLRSRGFRGAVSLRGGIDAWNREAAAGARR
jgi:adenylyltransferase/sulfurtransferase